MQWTDDINIETPEQIELSLEIAGMGSRFVAQVIDWLLKFFLVLVLAVLALVVGALLGAAPSAKTFESLLGALVIAAVFALIVGFDIYYEVRHNGQTPGKKFAGIRALKDSGAPLDFQAACIRNLLGLADFLPFAYLLGGLIMLLSPRGQRLGDLAAGTIVIRERAVRTPVDLDREIGDRADEAFSFTSQQLSACSPEDRHILRSYFLRCATMQPKPRHDLACRLADTFQTKIAYETQEPIVSSPRAEAFLASLYQNLEKWARHGA